MKEGKGDIDYSDIRRLPDRDLKNGNRNMKKWNNLDNHTRHLTGCEDKINLGRRV